MPQPHLLVIGNGGAAIHALQAIRASGHSGPLHLVSDTPGRAFNPMLSPYYLAGKIHFDDCFPFGDSFYKKFDISCHLGSPVETLDPADKMVLLKGGEWLRYDRCLVATGASPLLPPVPGLRKSNHVFTLRTAEDTILLHDTLSRTQRALILGASLIGVKVAEILVQRGVKVTIVDIAGQVLPHAAHPECAALLEAHFASKGVELHLSWNLEGVEDHGEEAVFYFEGNKTITADLCLVSTGVRSNFDFLNGSGVEIDQGILVDHRMRTSVEDLYAAGDVSQGRNILTGKKEVIGLWGNACYQGRTAGLNMSGRKTSYPGSIPDHISTLFGLTLVHLGNPMHQGNNVTILSNRDLSNGPYRLLVFDEGVLVGANLIDGFERAGKLKKAMIRKLNWEDHFGPLTRLPSDQEIEQFLADIPESSSVPPKLF